MPKCNVASSYHSLFVHIIFATRSRAPTIAPPWLDDLHRYIGGTLDGLGAKPMRVGGVADHVHILASIKATHAVADIVREVKKASSVWSCARFDGFAWQAGYAAFSVGANETSRIVQYIAHQAAHHRTVSSADELRQLLEENGVSLDERFFE